MTDKLPVAGATLYNGDKAFTDMVREQIDTTTPDLHEALIAATAREASRTRAAIQAEEYQRSADRARDAGERFRQRLNETAGVVAIGAGGGGGGGGNASPNQATGGYGSNGGLAVTCRTCGRPATRFSSPFSVSGGRLSAECAACNEARAMADRQRAAWLADATAQQHDAHVRARVAQPVPVQPERRLCACGQELRRTTAEGQAVVFPAGSLCGDCRQIERRYVNPKRAGDMSNGRSVATAKTLDARIAAAQPKAVDADPTQAWGAGATATWEWP